MASTESTEKLLPPYVPFGTFTNFVERLKNTATPSKIDNTLMPNLAGGVRGQVRSALRFLNLTTPDDIVTTTFKDLIQSFGADSWQANLASVIETAYSNVIGGLDLRGATAGLIQQRFRDAGLTGQMAEKAIRFFLAALESAGVPFSPHLKVRGATSSAKGGKKPRKRTDLGNKERHEEGDDLFQEGEEGQKFGYSRTRSFTFPIPGEPDIRVVVPEKIDDLDIWSMVDHTLRTYIRLNAKAKGATDEV